MTDTPRIRRGFPQARKQRRTFARADDLARSIASGLETRRKSGTEVNSGETTDAARFDPDHIFSLWQHCCDRCVPIATAHVHTVRIDDDVLVVYTDSPVWATRLRLATQSLLAGMRGSGLPWVSELRIRVMPAKAASAPKRKIRTAVLSPEASHVIDKVADRMGDSALGDSLRRLARARQSRHSDDQ